MRNMFQPEPANPETDVCFTMEPESVRHVQPTDWVSRAVPKEAMRFLDEKPLPEGIVLILWRVDRTMGLPIRLIFRKIKPQPGMTIVYFTVDLLQRIADGTKKEKPNETRIPPATDQHE
jgi:hypothetical protein